MESKKFGNKYVLRIDKGEKIVDTLKQFCINNKINLGTINGIGATDKATIGFFNVETKKYNSTEFIGDYEITNLTGNISTKNGEVYLHLHISLADEKYQSFGGHLTEAVVSATCEVVIDAIDGHIEREFSEDIGINIYKM